MTPLRASIALASLLMFSVSFVILAVLFDLRGFLEIAAVRSDVAEVALWVVNHNVLNLCVLLLLCHVFPIGLGWLKVRDLASWFLVVLAGVVIELMFLLVLTNLVFGVVVVMFVDPS